VTHIRIEVCDYTVPGAKGVKLEIEYSAIIPPVVLGEFNMFLLTF
jgi:hypothetical protein